MGLGRRFCFGARLAVVAILLIFSNAKAADQPPLTVIIQDGQVLFQGADLDLDELKSKLAATGRQKERIYFRIGPNAKSAYVQRVIDAIKAAGFVDIAVMPPPELGKDPEPPV